MYTFFRLAIIILRLLLLIYVYARQIFVGTVKSVGTVRTKTNCSNKQKKQFFICHQTLRLLNLSIELGNESFEMTVNKNRLNAKHIVFRFILHLIFYGFDLPFFSVVAIPSYSSARFFLHFVSICL